VREREREGKRDSLTHGGLRVKGGGVRVEDVGWRGSGVRERVERCRGS